MKLLESVKDFIKPGSIFDTAINVVDTVKDEAQEVLHFDNGTQSRVDELKFADGAKEIKHGIKEKIKDHIFGFIDLPGLDEKNEELVEDGIGLIVEGIATQILARFAKNQK